MPGFYLLARFSLGFAATPEPAPPVPAPVVVDEVVEPLPAPPQPEYLKERFDGTIIHDSQELHEDDVAEPSTWQETKDAFKGKSN